MSRKICVVTGSRAEYGILRPLIKEIKEDRGLKLQLVVTGTHLSSEFGLTYQEIIQDGFKIDKKVSIVLSSDSNIGITKSMAHALVRISKAYLKLKPDMVVILGDRFEIFSAAVAAHIQRIPIAHICGGELTEGAIDDAFRHSITKMSQLHFTSTEKYRRRVIQLGEDPSRVFRVGSLSLDNIKNQDFLSKKELEKRLNLKFNRFNILVTFHPVTLENNTSGTQFKKILNVLNGLKNTNIVFTKANADSGGRKINQLIDEYVKKNPQKATAFTSMGQLNYLSTMQFVDAVVGNSSSGIGEAPSFKIATVNIGDRQKGRIKAKSVIDCAPTKDALTDAFKKIYSKYFQRRLKNIKNLYGDGNAAVRIKNILKRYNITNIIRKKFYDI